jgi:hypothetical protein
MSYIYPPPIRFVVIERARGYSSGFSRILDETRYFNAVMVLRGSGRGTIAIIPNDDIASRRTWTVITAPVTGTAPTCVSDWDDSTYCEWSVAAGATTNLLQLDLGVSMYGILRLRHYTSSSLMYSQVYVSNDATTWTNILNRYAVGTVEDFIYVAGYRYLRFTGNNRDTTYSQRIRIYSVEFYPDYPLTYTRTLSAVSGRVAVFVYGAYYQLLEVISL